VSYRILGVVSTTDPDRRFPRIALTVAVLLAVLLLLSAAPSDAQPAVRQVLMLQSFDRGTYSVDQFTSNFRIELDRRATEPVNVVQVVVGPTGFVAAPERAVVDYIRSTFVDRPKPDLIVTVAGPAAVFARRYRQQLFPDTPILFGSVDRRFLDDAPLGDKEAAVAVDNQFSRTIETILQLRPEITQVFMVMGSGPLGRFWRRELESEFGRFHDRPTFVWSNDLSLQEILRRCTSLPEHSAILYVSFGTDAAGAAFPDERLFADLHETANAPLFAGQSVYLGHGIVGGPLLSIDDMSRDTADVAVRLLQGAAPKSINVPLRLPGQPTFDWRELQRWGIPESRLPPGSIVRYRAPSLWSAYRSTVLSVMGTLAIQSLLIIGLLYQRRARRRAEIESRYNLALAADASRRLTMSALTSSIAHELGQPLSSMIHNAQAGRMMITADRATPDTMGEIFSDIETEGVQATQIIDRHRAMLRGRQLDTKPVDLHVVIHESLALVAHDMGTRQVEATVNLSSSPCIITGDEVLLRQVMVNLLVNAMDAMADTPPLRRRITISTDVRAADVGVSVRDAGTGLPAQVNGALFTPFVTTKAHGLGIGLTITQTIVDAHGGTIDAHDNTDGGATFSVTLPRSETPEIVSQATGAA
jgi:signal transduction histidine kinase